MADLGLLYTEVLGGFGLIGEFFLDEALDLHHQYATNTAVLSLIGVEPEIQVDIAR